MKVIEKGRKKDWIGKTITCEHCGSKLKLEAGDKVRRQTDTLMAYDGPTVVGGPELGEGAIEYYITKCPVCKKTIHF